VGSALARGGMLTKVLAARRAARSGAFTIVASGEEPDVLLRLAAGEAVGTLLTPDTAPMAARKQWLADHLQVRGEITVDAGAVRALLVEGKSLLPIGATAVGGEFDRGELVRCVGPDGAEIARGLANYPAAEIARLLGVQSRDIESRLGYVGEPELIHRDNLVVTSTAR
ncbi:MAG: glutamate 5-kinase, partial [Proteobacteria bacterium]|nr:glutamate 5-kinase [Burkholderiales bacterium]